MRTTTVDVPTRTVTLVTAGDVNWTIGENERLNENNTPEKRQGFTTILVDRLDAKFALTEEERTTAETTIYQAL